MKIINIRKLLLEANGLDIVKDLEEESGIKLVKRKAIIRSLKNEDKFKSSYENSFNNNLNSSFSIHGFNYGDCSSYSEYLPIQSNYARFISCQYSYYNTTEPELSTY